MEKSPKSVLETKDKFRRTPLEYASDQGGDDIIKLIESAEGKKPKHFVLSQEDVSLFIRPVNQQVFSQDRTSVKKEPNPRKSQQGRFS